MRSLRWALAVSLFLGGCNSSTPIGTGDMSVGDMGTGTDGGGGGGDMASGFGPESVLEHHKHQTRDGLYTEPSITTTAAATMHIDPMFSATLNGPTYAQPLYLDNGQGGRDLVIVATEQNEVDAFDAGTGALVWQKTAADLGQPAPLSSYPSGCGDIDPFGITGTPAIDPATRTMFFDTVTLENNQHHHKVWGISVDDGSIRPGWPVDVNTAVSGFDGTLQGQRPALLVLGGTVYVGYGGLAGDCGNYYGRVIGFPEASPSSVVSWHTRSVQAAVWAPGGLTSDGTSVFAVTGNSPNGTTPWGDEEAVIRFAPGPSYNPVDANVYYPSDWMTLDTGDLDLSGSSALLVDVPGATPSKLVVALGKDKKAYLLNRDNLGGMGGELAQAVVANGEIINAAAAYTTAMGTYVVFKAPCPTGAGNLVAIKIGAASPPTINVAWCADQKGGGSPMVTTVDGHAQAIVWALGTEQEGGAGDSRLHGFDGDTGAVIYAGGGAGDQMDELRRFTTPIAAKGHIYVASDGHLYKFDTN